MKQVLVLAMLSVWMFSCNETAATKTDSAAADSPAIDTVVPAPNDTIARKDTTPAEPTYHASFRVLFTSTYCGGARPSEEILAEKATPKVLSLSWVKFKNHFTGKEYVLQTNAEGIAETEMEEGKYDVFFTKDINPKLSTGFDPKCSLWQNQLLLTVKVTSSGKTQDVNVHFVCNPCDETMKRRP
jgi:hypothetical protein